MTVTKLIAAAALVVMLVSACAAPSPTQPTQPPASPVPPTPATQGNLAGTAWKLVSFGPAGSETPALPNANITLTFDNQGQAGGNAGCNSYGGAYTAASGKLQIGPMMRTLMACADNAVMQQEDNFLAALEQAASYELNADQLLLTSADGGTRLVFSRGG